MIDAIADRIYAEALRERMVQDTAKRDASRERLTYLHGLYRTELWLDAERAGQLRLPLEVPRAA